MKKIIIELEVDGSDWSDSEISAFLAESERASVLSVEVTSPIGGDTPALRYYDLSTEYFHVRTE